MGKDAEAAITRAPFALDLAAKKPLIPVVNDMFKKLSGGRDMADVSARAFTGFLTLVDAINRAGSTDPAAIQKALRETDIPADQLLMPWTGVKFDDKGQNIGVRAILQQMQGGSYHTIYPFDLALKDAIYPVPAWSQRK
jgi:branched-chain amino acid transport system substrate-binding protein